MTDTDKTAAPAPDLPHDIPGVRAAGIMIPPAAPAPEPVAEAVCDENGYRLRVLGVAPVVGTKLYAHPPAAPAPAARELWDMIQAYANEEMNNGANVRAAVEQIVRERDAHKSDAVYLAERRDYWANRCDEALALLTEARPRLDSHWHRDLIASIDALLEGK